MKQDHKKNNYGYYAALVVGIAALVVLVGVYTVRQNNVEKNQFVDLNSDDSVNDTDETAKAVGGDVSKASNSDVSDADSNNTDSIGKADLAQNKSSGDSQPNTSTQSSNSSGDASTSQSANANDEGLTQKDGSETDDGQESTTEQNSDANEEQTKQTATDNVFSKKSVLTWPVTGNVIIPFSMKTTVHFKTIDAYKCNPGMLIEAKEGTSVYSSFAGTVKSIEKNTERGTVVSVDLGGNYLASYGQLKDVCVQEGQRISKGTAIGTVAKPSAMYSKEGTHLFFSLQKGEKYINPETFLQ